MFGLYHVSHHLFLFRLIIAVLAGGFLSLRTGFDWEFWNEWLTWLLVWMNLTAFFKYASNLGEALESPNTSVATILVPGIADASYRHDMNGIVCKCVEPLYFRVLFFHRSMNSDVVSVGPWESVHHTTPEVW